MIAKVLQRMIFTRTPEAIWRSFISSLDPAVRKKKVTELSKSETRQLFFTWLLRKRRQFMVFSQIWLLERTKLTLTPDCSATTWDTRVRCRTSGRASTCSPSRTAWRSGRRWESGELGWRKTAWKPSSSSPAARSRGCLSRTGTCQWLTKAEATKQTIRHRFFSVIKERRGRLENHRTQRIKSRIKVTWPHRL